MVTMRARSAQWNSGLPHTVHEADTALIVAPRGFALIPSRPSASAAIARTSASPSTGPYGISRSWFVASACSSMASAARSARPLLTAALVRRQAQTAVDTASTTTPSENSGAPYA